MKLNRIQVFTEKIPSLVEKCEDDWSMTLSLDLISSQLNPTPSKKGSEKPNSRDINKWSYKSACIQCDINMQSQKKDMVLQDQSTDSAK